MAAPWTWIFQANPDQWDARRCLSEQPGLFWKVAAYRSDINIGDTVYLWESGKQRHCSRRAPSHHALECNRRTRSTRHT
jgi:hypothetical protein